MNDFTKEELLSILGAFKYVEDDPGWRSTTGWDDEVKNKIQSMIDNYCEHEWRCFDDEHNTRECIKCGEERTGEINDNPI